MIAIMKMSGKFYGRDLSNLDNDEKMDYIEGFTIQDEPCTLVLSLDSACDLFDIEESDIEMVYGD